MWAPWSCSSCLLHTLEAVTSQATGLQSIWCASQNRGIWKSRFLNGPLGRMLRSSPETFLASAGAWAELNQVHFLCQICKLWQCKLCSSDQFCWGETSLRFWNTGKCDDQTKRYWSFGELCLWIGNTNKNELILSVYCMYINNWKIL